MDIDVFSPRELPTVFRVLRTALSADAALDANERSFLDTLAHITAFGLRQADPPVISAQDVHIAGRHQRKRLIQLAALAVLLSRPVKAGSLAFLKTLARQLDTHDTVIDVIDALAAGRRLRVRLLAMRRGMRVMLKEAYLAEGPQGVVRLLAAMLLKAPVNRDKLGRYKRLGLLPEGTLGREYWKHMTERDFGFPGEPGGIADSVTYHDIVHVLAENDTTPLGEIQQGSFLGGNRREDGFFFIQFVVLQFHHGVKVTPTSAPYVGLFDPEKLLWAIHRGARCSVDTTHQWNFWPLMALPLAEARAACTVLPKLPMASGLRNVAGYVRQGTDVPPARVQAELPTAHHKGIDANPASLRPEHRWQPIDG